MQDNKIRIVAIVIDTTQLTLYKVNGETLIIPQGDLRVRRIVDEATPLLLSQGYADVSIDKDPEANHYADFEQKSSGLVKFFRVAKEKLKNLFTSVPEGTIGTIPTPPVSQDNSGLDPAVLEKAQADLDRDTEIGRHECEDEVNMISAVEEIMQHAVPVSSPEYHEDNVAKQGNVCEKDGKTDDQRYEKHTATDTIIAVVDGQIIPGMERIKTQFAHASKLSSSVGMDNFLKRIAAVINQRSHSVEDLLKFMERADLPIAEDGSIIIYKVLLRSEDKYVDCHSRQVTQFVGAYVCMDESLVDPNRRNECSNGLHVARRGYISGFSGDVCVLAKLAPEDVIAVPTYDANKMRVCGYHIIKELPDNLYTLLKKNRPITDELEGQKILADALAGKHIQRTHEVRIQGQMGANVKVTVLHPSSRSVATPTAVSVAVPVEEAAAVPQAVMALGNPGEDTDIPLMPKDVIQKVEQLSRKEQAAKLHEEYMYAQEGDENGVDPIRLAKALDALLTFKKVCKVGWDRLGIPDPTAKVTIMPEAKTKFSIPAEAMKGKSFGRKKAKVTKAAAKVAKSVQKLKKAAGTITPQPIKEQDVIIEPQAFKAPPVPPVPKTTDKRVVNGVELGEGSPRERIQKLLDIGLDSVGVAQAILALKKKSKKSWETLGVDADTVAQVMKLAES